MADRKKSRVLLTLGQKVEAISQLDDGVPAYKIAEKLGVGKTQIQNLRKRKAELMSDYENNVPSDSKRRRHFTGNEEINESTLAWVNYAIHRRINVTGPLIQTKALEFSERLGITDIKASKGWLESFTKRNCLVFGTISGERGDVKIATVHNWKSKLPKLCENYEPAGIFNMDETDYYCNKKAWMNSFIYKDFLKTFNRRIKSQKRNVLLFVDIAPSHPEVELSNVKVEFLPPTSLTQPMDQGIIQSTKLKFRKRQLKHMVKEMDRNATVCGSDILKQINILDAIYWLKNSWTEVEEHTIKRCFEKAGLKQIQGPEVDNEHSDNNDDDDDIPLAAIKMVKDVFGCTFKECFVTELPAAIGDPIALHSSLTALPGPWFTHFTIASLTPRAARCKGTRLPQCLS
ncbi:tigger transposable element-derived protein 4-like [Argopecten irradians]|uniref:tigger transposable element-derived protein 4-like n=1 Tax=Argopecten irradians TaxID=31199 RepID=UPI003712D3A6